MFFIVAIVVGGGIGVGGYWAYDTYFPSNDRLVEKAEDKYAKAEEAFQDNRKDQAEALYNQANAYLVKLENKVAAENKDPSNPKPYNNPKAPLLRAKIFARLSRLAEDRDKEKGDMGPKSEHANLAVESNNALLQTLKQDKDNVEAAGILLDKCFTDDELDKAEPYAEAVVKYQPGPDEEMTKEMALRVAGAHFVLAKAALRGPIPKPELALDHVSKIKDLLALAHVDMRWREIAVEAEALKARKEMAVKTATPTAKPAGAKGVVKDDVGEELRRNVLAGLDKAKQDLRAVENDNPFLVTLSPTNTRGLLDFLVLAVEVSTLKEEIIERSRLLLDVCEQLVASPRKRESTTRAVAAHLAQLPATVDKPAAERKIPALRLLAADWKPIEERMLKVVDLTNAAGASLDADSYLELARKAHKDNRWKDAEAMAKKGLDWVRTNTAKYAKTPDLHGEAAWAMFLQGNTKGAEEHLIAMRKERGLARTANLIDGLTAVREGRLETGVRNLLTAQQDARYTRSVLTYMGLARAYEGLGQTERALVMLRKLENAYKSADLLSDEERTLAADFLPDADSVNFEILRCLLTLNQVDEALKYKERLDKRSQGLAARILLINYYVNRGREALAQNSPLDARDDFDAARKELSAARTTYPDDPNLVWADTMLTASQPDLSRPFGLQASAGSPKAGLTSVERADRALRDYVAKKKDFESHLLWVRWLETQGRFEDADAALTQMEKDFPDRQKVVQAVRARLSLVRNRSSEVAKLVEALRGKPSDLSSDVLQLLHLLAPESSTSKSQTLQTVLGKHESNVLHHLWQGHLDQHAGNLAEAARAYGRALPPSRYQTEAQIGLLTSLLALSAKDSPKSAAELIDQLRRDNSIDPIVLLAYAEMNRRLDNIGREGMEGGLRSLERVLTSQKQDAAIAADFLARGLYAAGRADMARNEVARALQLDPSYPPALALAARLAAEAEDWEGCLNHAETLERTLYGTPDARRETLVGDAPRSVLDRTQPTLCEAQAWRAAALEQLDRKEEAKRVYQDLMAKHPKLSAGYLGLAAMRERAGDLRGALQYVEQWREKNPTDADGLTAHVRLLVKAKKVDEAGKVADQFLADTQKAKNADEYTTLLTGARAFADAKAYDQAEAWGQKALAAADKKDKAAIVDAQMVLGEAYTARAMAEQGDARKADVEKALTAYKAVWTLMPGHRAAGIRMAYLQAKERKQGEAAYAAAQDSRKGPYSQKMIGGDRLSLEQLGALGEIYRTSGHAGEAVTLFRDAVKRYPLEPMVHQQLGLACRDQRMNRDAVLALNQAQLLAQQKADAAKDAEQKTRWQAVADEARTEREKIEFKPAVKQ
jgi:hypothetical protein